MSEWLFSTRDDATTFDNADRDVVSGCRDRSSLNRGMEEVAAGSSIFTAEPETAGSFLRMEISGTRGVRAVSTCLTHLLMLPVVPYILLGELGERSSGLLALLLG